MEKQKNTAEIQKMRTVLHCMNCLGEYDTEHFDTCPYCGFAIGTPPGEEYHLFPGTVLAGHYVMGTVLGFGGFGITYRAWDEQLNSGVAIKEYYPMGQVNRIPGEREINSLAGKSALVFRNGVEDFKEEARNTSRFNTHPNIVHVYDVIEENNTAYQVMELLNGENLYEFMQHHGGRISVPEAVDIFSQLSEALKELHSKGLIHCDLSPDNFFVCTNGNVKLLDLGAARYAGEREDRGNIVLKVGMAPPEQYFEAEKGPWTDVYALSASLYWALTGEKPEESTDRQREDNLIPPSQLNPEIPPSLERTILKGMELMPELRFQSIEEFGQALRGEMQVLDSGEMIRRRKRMRTLITGTAAVIAIGGITAGAWMYRYKRSMEYLGSANMTLWIPGFSDEDVEEAAWKEALGQFFEDYPAVNVQLEVISKERYTDRLEEAFANGEAPTLFVSSGLDMSYESAFADLKPALERLNRDQYYFFSDYYRMYPARDRIPMGFHTNLVYANAVLARDNEVLTIPGENDVEAFLQKECLFCVADTTCFYEMQENLRAVYSIFPVEEAVKAAVFDTEWSVRADADEGAQKAAMRMIGYLMTPACQQLLHIEHRQSLPVEREVLEEYCNVYPQLTEVLESPEDFRLMTKEEMERVNADYFKKLASSETFLQSLTETGNEQ